VALRRGRPDLASIGDSLLSNAIGDSLLGRTQVNCPHFKDKVNCPQLSDKVNCPQLEEVGDELEPVHDRRFGAGLQVQLATDVGRHNRSGLARFQVFQFAITQ